MFSYANKIFPVTPSTGYGKHLLILGYDYEPFKRSTNRAHPALAGG